MKRFISVTDPDGKTRVVDTGFGESLDWGTDPPDFETDKPTDKQIDFLNSVISALGFERDELASKVKELKHELALLRAETAWEEE